MDGREIDIRWNREKDELLRARRGIGFERVALMMEAGNYLAVIDHWNPIRYPNQKVFVLNIDDYAYYVPFVETAFEIFLKTIFRSRKATKLHLRGN